MVQLLRQRNATIIELGHSYESLDEDAIEEVGSVLLREAATVEPPQLVLDFARTELIGSSFLELLVRVWKRLCHRGGALTLCGVNPFCAEVLHVTRLDTLWETYGTRAEALAAVADAGQADGRQ